MSDMVEKSIETRYYDLSDAQMKRYEELWEEYVSAQQEQGNDDSEDYRQLVEGILVRQYLAKEMIANVKTDENFCLTAELMNDLSNKDDTSELMAIIEMREDKLENVPLSENPFIVLFDRPSNKGNLGTMIRSCDALGADMLIITGHSIDLYDPDVVVSAMGSFFNMPVIRIADNNDLFMYLNKLKEQYPNFLTVGTTAHKQNPIYSADLTVPLMLMMGNETMGLNKAYKEYCDLLCTIPMSEKSYASSFNVSCAASILMYEITRQRGIK